MSFLHQVTVFQCAVFLWDKNFIFSFKNLSKVGWTSNFSELSSHTRLCLVQAIFLIRLKLFPEFVTKNQFCPRRGSRQRIYFMNSGSSTTLVGWDSLLVKLLLQIPPTKTFQDRVDTRPKQHLSNRHWFDWVYTFYHINTKKTLKLNEINLKLQDTHKASN